MLFFNILLLQEDAIFLYYWLLFIPPVYSCSQIGELFQFLKSVVSTLEVSRIFISPATVYLYCLFFSLIVSPFFFPSSSIISVVVFWVLTNLLTLSAYAIICQVVTYYAILFLLVLLLWLLLSRWGMYLYVVESLK